MNWKFVYNTRQAGWQMHNDVVQYVKTSGYKFYTWGGFVYFIDEEGNFHKTPIKEEDLA